jgi:LacI family transcriptional regulator
MERLGYEPNFLARNMRNQKTMTVGCVIRDISIQPLGSFVKSVQDILFDDNFMLVIGNSHGDVAREKQLINHFMRTQAEGLILSLGTERNEDYFISLQKRRYPVVLLDREGPSWADSVLADHENGTKQAVSHLLGLGHRDIVLLTGGNETFPGRARLSGYLSAFKAAGIAVNPNMIRNRSYLPEFAFSELSSLLHSSERPSAVIAGGIEMLGGVLSAIRSAGLVVPRDISVVAVSDDGLAQFASPAIGIVRWNLGEVGRLVAGLLLERIGESAHKAPPRRIKVPTEFVPRESCAPPYSR